MKTKWPTKKLGEVCEINMGQSPASSTYNTNQDGLPFYQGKKDFGEKYPTPRIWCSNPIKIVEVGDILISVRAPVGALNVAKEKSCIGRGLAGLRAKKELNQDFLFCYLQLVEEDISALGIGSTFTAISRKHLENLEIPLPPLSEQKRIVEKIEKLFAKIDEAERLRAETLAASAALLPSALHKVFSRAKKENWPTKKLGEIAETKMGGTPRTTHKEFWDNGNIIWITPEDMKKDMINFIRDSRRKITTLGLEKSSAKLFPKDTVFVSTTATIGKIGIAEREISANQQITGIICKASMMPKFLAYYFLYLGENGLKMIGGQLVATHINQTNFRKLEIPLPPLSKQKKIVAYLDALSQKSRELQKIQQQTAADFSALRQSILAQAFNQNS